jgi:hypothetical protein
MMFQAMAIKSVGRKVGFRRLQRKGVSRHEGQQSAAPPAERAITIKAFGELSLDLVGNLAAMAASLMQHIRAPVLNEAMAVKVRKQS